MMVIGYTSPMLTAFVNIFCCVWSLHDLIMAKPFSPVNTLKAYSDSDLRNNAQINPFYRPGQKSLAKLILPPLLQSCYTIACSRF